MGLSIRELKANLTAHGVDFSTCREKSELEQLWADLQQKDSTAEVEQACRPPQQLSQLADGGFASRSTDGRHCWVEFVDGNDALCLWEDGSDAIIEATELQAAEELPGPPAFAGSFEAARTEAFQSGRLLVAAVHSDKPGASKADRLQVLTLASEHVAPLVQENAVFWRGALRDLRAPHQQQLAPNGVPAVAMVLPLAVDAMRVLFTSPGAKSETIVDEFVQSLDKMEEHRQAAELRLLSGEALLRQEQDEEFAACLAADRVAEEAKASMAETSRSGDAAASDLASLESENCLDAEGCEGAETGSQPEIEAEQLAKRRRLLAEEFLAEKDEGSETGSTVRLMLRLPTGERLQRTFSAHETLGKVQRWAECCAHLPEAAGQELHIPAKFELNTAFPRRRLGGSEEENQKTLGELGLAPSAALLLISDE